MTSLAKICFILGGSFIFLGALLAVVGKIPGVGKLPGDIMIKKENFTFYFPLATCLLLSVVLSLIFRLWNNK